MSQRTLLCIPVEAETSEGMLAGMRQAAGQADVVELRLDSLRDGRPDVLRLVEARRGPVIVTCRPRREGGAFAGDEADRLALLREAVEAGADFVDVELDSAHRLPRGGRSRIIVSHHDFQQTPADLDGLFSRIRAARPDVAKVAVMATDIRDNLRLFDAMRRSPLPTIGIAIGELGVISRVLAPRFGGFLTFASLATGRESAPGQLTAAEMRATYRFDRIGPETAIYGLIADPVAHSMSPAIHNAAFDHVGLDAVYALFKVESDPVGFVRDFEALGVRGYSVSIPHKEAVLPAVDESEPLVKRIGALNTIVFRGGRRFGYNTDYSGALQALEDAVGGETPLRGRRVAILGAGGAARALVFGALDRGARVTILNRTHDRAARLAEEAGCEAHPLADFASLPPPDVLINTTSVGMWPEVDDTPVPASNLSPGTFVYDCVFNPLDTRLLREARERGCRTLNGVDWFIGQGAAQFELWTGRPAPREVMRRAMIQGLGGRP